MITRDRNRAGRQVAMNDGAMSRPGRLLPGWRQALAVAAHPDDETFGLGAVADRWWSSMTPASPAILTIRRRRAARMHTSQISPSAVVWRRLRLQGTASTCAGC